MKVPGFVGGLDEQRSLNLSDNQCVNLYPTTNSEGNITAFYKCDGLKQEAVLAGIPTGGYVSSIGREFYVTGATLYEIDSALISTSRGTLTAGTYEFSDNGIELICVNGTDGWLFTFSTNVLAKIKVLTGTVTITLANPAVINKTAHGLVAVDRVLFSTTGFLPDKILTHTPYYIIAAGLTANAFEISATSGGTAISTLADLYTNSFTNSEAVAYGNGLFVSVTSIQSDSSVSTSPDGKTWTVRKCPIGSWVAIAWNGTVFAAVSAAALSSTNRVMTSPNGIDWTSRVSAADNKWQSIAWNGTVFAAVSTIGVGNRVMTSPDGITWTIRVSAADNNWRGIAWNGTVFAAVASSGANPVMTSPDGITWTIRTAASLDTWRAIAWNGTVFAAVADYLIGYSIMTSPDGITWTSRNTPSVSNWLAITWNGTLFAAVGYSAAGNTVMTSPDGITWTSRTTPVNNTLQGIAWNGTVFVAVANAASANTLISADGITWTNYRSYGTHTYLTIGYGFPNGCKTVSYLNGRFAVVEPNTQNLLVSEPLNGAFWDQLNIQTVDSNPDYCVGQVVSHNELIVFCENSSEIFSDSGTTPTPFVRNLSGIFEVGLAAAYSVASLDNSVFWLGRSKEGRGIVYRLAGLTPVRVSTFGIENTIQAMSIISDARAFSYQKDGHHFYTLTFPSGNKTFTFDANSNLWHERASFVASVMGKWEPQFYLFFNNKHYVTDYLTSNLYSIDSSIYSNGTNPLKVIRSFRAPESDMKRVIHHRLQLDAEFGVTVLSDPEAVVMLRWSNDGGHTWSNLLNKGIGAVGEYFKRVIWNRLGITKGPARIYEISCTDNVKLMLKDVYLD